MKTIEEAAREHANKTWRESVVGEWDSNELKLFCNNDFIHGARFAQKWIPVEEGLPEDESERYGTPGVVRCSGFVEVMSIDFPKHMQSAYYNFDAGVWISVITLKEIRPTHWRYIYLK